MRIPPPTPRLWSSLSTLSPSQLAVSSGIPHAAQQGATHPSTPRNLQGYGEEEDSWEDAINILDRALIEDFRKVESGRLVRVESRPEAVAMVAGEADESDHERIPTQSASALDLKHVLGEQLVAQIGTASGPGADVAAAHTAASPSAASPGAVPPAAPSASVVARAGIARGGTSRVDLGADSALVCPPFPPACIASERPPLERRTCEVDATSGAEEDSSGSSAESDSWDRCGTFGCTLRDKHPGLHCIPELGKRVRRPPPAPRSPRSPYKICDGRGTAASPKAGGALVPGGGPLAKPSRASSTLPEWVPTVPIGEKFQVEVPLWDAEEGRRAAVGSLQSSPRPSPTKVAHRELEDFVAENVSAALTACAFGGHDGGHEPAAVAHTLRPSALRSLVARRIGSTRYDLDESDAELESEEGGADFAPAGRHRSGAGGAVAVRLGLGVCAGAVNCSLRLVPVPSQRPHKPSKPKRCGVLGCILPDRHVGIHQIVTMGARKRRSVQVLVPGP